MTRKNVLQYPKSAVFTIRFITAKAYIRSYVHEYVTTAGTVKELKAFLLFYLKKNFTVFVNLVSHILQKGTTGQSLQCIQWAII